MKLILILTVLWSFSGFACPSNAVDDTEPGNVTDVDLTVDETPDGGETGGER